MALIKCSECGKEISDKAKTCVNCGCPIENKEYRKDIKHLILNFPIKKTILTFLCLSILFVLASLFLFNLSFGDTFGTLLMIAIIFVCILIPIIIIKKFKNNNDIIESQNEKRIFVNNSTNVRKRQLYIILVIISILIINMVYLLWGNTLFNNNYKNIGIFGNLIASLIFTVISLVVIYIKNITNSRKKIFLITILLLTLCFVFIFDIWLINKSDNYKTEYIETIQKFQCEQNGGVWVNGRCLDN